MLGLFVSKLIPVAGELLKLGVFKSVAVREEEGRFQEVIYKDTYDKPVEIITFYNVTRNKDHQKEVQALHIYFKGTPEELFVEAYTSNYPYIQQGIMYLNIETCGLNKVGEINTTFGEELTNSIEQWIMQAKKIFDITPKRKIHKFYDENINFLSKAYGKEFSELEMMSVHFSLHLPTVHIISESGWGSNFQFTLTKDKQHVAMKVEIDEREFSDGEGKTYREVKPIDEDFAKTLELFFLDCNFITKKVLLSKIKND